MAYRLTDKDLRGLLARQKKSPLKKRQKVADGEGLFVSVEPSGALLWRYKFRFEAREKEMALGEYTGTPHGVSIASARDKHQAAKALLAAGINPIEHRKAEATKAAEQAVAAKAGVPSPFAEAADGWLATRRPAKAKGLDDKEARARFRVYARDARMVGYLKNGKGGAKGFGKVAIGSVDYTAHLMPLLDACNHPTRIRLAAAARKIIAYGKARGFYPKHRTSPFADIDYAAGYAKHKETHRPAITDPAKFGQLLRKIQSYEGSGDNLTSYALKLLALTFVRPGTIAAAKWRHFNLNGGFWVVPFEKLKMATERSETGKSEDDYIIPLSRQAVALLREVHKITGDGEYLFPGRGGGRTISSDTLNYALHGLGYKNTHCAHGFRATASTLLNRERTKDGRRRFERELVEMQQDRLDRSTRAVYDRDDRLPERIELMQHWADMVDRLRGGDVVQLPERAARR